MKKLVSYGRLGSKQMKKEKARTMGKLNVWLQKVKRGKARVD